MNELQIKDRRVKLSAEQKEEIISKYNNEELDISVSQLARDYNVSRRTIGFIVSPDSYNKQREYLANRWKARAWWAGEAKQKQLTALKAKLIKVDANRLEIIRKIKAIENYLSIM